MVGEIWSNLLSLLGSSASWWLLCTKYISGKVGKAFNSWQTVTKCPWKLGNQSFFFQKSRKFHEKIKNFFFYFWRAQVIKMVANNVGKPNKSIFGLFWPFSATFHFWLISPWFLEKKFREAGNASFWPLESIWMTPPCRFSSKKLVRTIIWGGSKKCTSDL